MHFIDTSVLAPTHGAEEGARIQAYVGKGISELGLVDKYQTEALRAAVKYLPAGDTLETEDILAAFLCLLGVVATRRHTLTASTLFYSELEM